MTAEEQIECITDLMNDLDLKEMIHKKLLQREKLWKEIRGLSIEEIEELIWGWYCFIFDIYDTLNM